MKTLIPGLVLFAAGYSHSAWAQPPDIDSLPAEARDPHEIVGVWAGTMVVEGEEVHLLFEIEANGQSLTATLNGQSQGWPPLAMTGARFDGGHLILRQDEQDMTYDAITVEAGRLAGTFYQGDRVVDLPMFKVSAPDDPPLNDAGADEVSGIWEGTMKFRGRDLPLVFHVDADGDALTATMDSPSQRVVDVAMDEARYDGGRFVLALNAGGIRYDGVLTEPGRMMGLFTQGELRLGLTLLQVESASEFRSNIPDPPQTPKPPFPYAVPASRLRRPWGLCAATRFGPASSAATYSPLCGISLAARSAITPSSWLNLASRRSTACAMRQSVWAPMPSWD